MRNPRGIYKYGRTTLKEQNAFKIKRFEDSEALVIGMEPEMHNANAAEINELGRTKRSTRQSGLIEKKSMGALTVHDPKFEKPFNIGTGFSAADREWWYEHWRTVSHREIPIVYKYFPVGIKEVPRHPVFKGFRDRRDM